MAGVPMNPADEHIVWEFVDLLRAAHLLNDAILEHHDAIPHGDRLYLIVRYVNKGGIQAMMEAGDLRTHLGAEDGVEVGERLVHQEDIGLAHDGPPQGDALALTAGKLARPALQEMLDAQHGGGLLHATIDFGSGRLAQLEAERHVVIDVHMGIERIILEDHGNVPGLGRYPIHQSIADEDLAPGDRLQSGDAIEHGGFSAAAGTKQNHELAVPDLQAHVLYRRHFAETLAEILRVTLATFRSIPSRRRQ